MKIKNNIKSDNWYWLIGNSIDGVCCHPRRKKTSERELMAYLETSFLEDFNASRGEFDFTIYLHEKGFRVRQLYGYYLEGTRKNVVAQVDYMTADAIHRVLRRGRTFCYYNHHPGRPDHHVLRIVLPSTASKPFGPIPCVRKGKGKICQIQPHLKSAITVGC